MEEKRIMTEKEFWKFLEGVEELLEEHIHIWDIHGGPCYSCKYLIDDSFCTFFREEKENIEEVHIDEECWEPGALNGFSLACSFAEGKVQEKSKELYEIYKEEGMRKALERVVEIWDETLWLEKEKKEELSTLLKEYVKSKYE
jgi:hypothetical protein